MRPPRRTRFGRYNLLLEVSVLVLTSAILFMAVWFTLAEINQRYLDLRLADAAKVHLFLESRLDDARTSLASFADLTETERSSRILTLFPAFSNLYRLDPRLRVEHIYKAAADSKVFAGFSFAGGKLARYLRSAGTGTDYSEIMRGHEDDAPSLYYAIQRGGQLYLGRLNLDYVQSFLTQFSRFSGTPVMLVAKDGFVMLSSNPELQIPAIDLRKWAGAPSPGRTLLAGQRHWVPMISQTSAIGARIVTLIPTELLTTQRNTLLIFASVFAGVLVLLVYFKNRQLNRLVVQPLASFADKMGDLAQGRLPSTDAADNYRFEELADIHTRFRAMAEAIREREASLRASERHAEEANRAKSMFLAHMSHEIRTPMNAILGLSELALHRSLDPTSREYLGHVHQSAQTLLGILNDVLDQSKLESGHLSLDLVAFDHTALLEQLRVLFAPAAATKGLDLAIEADPEVPRALLGDPLRLQQILSNLLSNALKFTDQGQIRLRATRQEYEGSGARLRWMVTDSGIGMDADTQARLFEPFTQGDRSIARRFGGTGLGLCISRRLAELMGGTLAAASTPGMGSAFTLELTLELATASVETVVAPLARGLHLAGARILVAEDQPLNRRVIGDMLRLLGAQVTLANHGGEALARLAETPFDAVLMDIQMPEMDGLTATRRIRANPAWADLPVIALTAGVTEPEQERMRACGLNDLLPKPVTLDALATTLGRWLPTWLERPVAAPQPSDTASSAGGGVTVPGFDLRVLYQLTNDASRLFHYLHRFADTIRDDAAAITAALTQDEIATARARTHRLKGAASLVGATALVEAARALEETLQAEADSTSVLAALRQAHAEALDRIAALPAPPDAEESRPISAIPETARPLVTEIHRQLVNGLLPPRALLAELEALLPAEDRALVYTLRAHLDRIDYPAARELLVPFLDIASTLPAEHGHAQ